jgi:small subunit ribosomal protein S6
MAPTRGLREPARLGGQLEKSENWGRRKLAYEIGRHKEGTYVLEVINGSGELMKELDRRLKVVDQVIRHLLVRVDEEQRLVERTRAHRQAESERRRVARGLPPQRQPGEGQPAGGDRDEGHDDRVEGLGDRGAVRVLQRADRRARVPALPQPRLGAPLAEPVRGHLLPAPEGHRVRREADEHLPAEPERSVEEGLVARVEEVERPAHRGPHGAAGNLRGP